MTEKFGYGYQFPGSSNDQFNAISFLVRQIVARMSTMKPVKVMAVSITPGTIGPSGKVDVLPLVTQIDGSGHKTSHGTVFGIPFFRICGGGNQVICDPVVGDFGFVVVSDRDISAVVSSRGEAAPGSHRQFDLADGIYVGGILCEAPEQSIAFTSEGVKVTDKNGNVLEMKSGGFFLTGTLNVTDINVAGHFKGANGTLYNGSIETASFIKAGGNVQAGVGGVNVIGLTTHTHSSASPGNQTSPPTVNT